ncbi:MAG: DUF1801 domain-containing protein [Sandaracinaceae bacterium]|nr:DUF1801 domain-containing protein [Sandaracinaceae bacterium]
MNRAKAGAKTGTLEELLEASAPGVRPLLLEARRLVRELHPEVDEEVRLGDRAVSWGLGPKKMTEGYAYVMPHATHANLGFYQGALLDDPAGLLEGTGKRMRHAKLKTVEDVERCRGLLVAALEERRRALGR